MARAATATAHRTSRCWGIIGVSFGCARACVALCCNFDIAVPLTVVCAAQASTSTRSHTKPPTSATRAGPRPGGGTPPPRRRDTRRGPLSLKSSHKKKTHAPCDAAAPGGQHGPGANAPQHTMDDRYLPRMGRGSIIAAREDRTQEGWKRRSGRDDAEGGGGGDADACGGGWRVSASASG